MDASIHIRVTGLVQGVGFRYFVYRHAAALNLRGYARNSADGAVEIEAEGERSDVETLLLHVRSGPRSARVASVEVEWGSVTGQFRDFSCE